MDINWWKLILLSFLLLECTAVLAQSSVTPGCEYGGNMCNVDLQRCASENIDRSCTSVYYPLLSSTRGDVSFFANISINKLHRYAPNVTYSVISRMRTSSKEKFTYVENCCNLKPNEICTMRKMKVDEEFYIFAPRALSGSYCFRQIQETDPIQWCFNATSINCMDLLDGFLKMRNEFRTTSISDQTDTTSKLKTKFYFFKLQRGFASTGYRALGRNFTRDVTDVTLDQGSKKVHAGGKEIEILHETDYELLNLNSLISNFSHTPCEMWCFFFHVEERFLHPQPSCYTPDDATNLDICEPFDPVHLLVSLAVVAFVILLLAAIVIYGVVKSKINFCLPDSEEVEKEIHPETKKVFMEKEDGGNPICEKEIPESVFISKGEKEVFDEVQQKISQMTDIIRDPEDIHGGQKQDDIRHFFGQDKIARRDQADSVIENDSHDVFSVEEEISDPFSVDDVYYDKHANVEILPDSGFGTHCGSGLSSIRSVGSEYKGEYDADPSFICSISVGKELTENPVSSVYMDKGVDLPAMDDPFIQDASSFESSESTGDAQPNEICHKDSCEADKLICPFPEYQKSQRNSSSSSDTGCGTNSYSSEDNGTKSLTEDDFEFKNALRRLPGYVQKSFDSYEEELLTNIPGRLPPTETCEYVSK